MAAAAFRHFRLLSFLAVLETFPLSNAPAIDRVKALDWETALSAPELSLWVDPELVKALMPRFEPRHQEGAGWRSTLDAADSSWVRDPVVETDAEGNGTIFRRSRPTTDARCRRSARKYGVPSIRVRCAEHRLWPSGDLRTSGKSRFERGSGRCLVRPARRDRSARPLRARSLPDWRVPCLLRFPSEHGSASPIDGVVCVLLTAVGSSVRSYIVASVDFVTVDVRVSRYGAQNDVPWRYDPAFGVTRPAQ